MQDHPALPPSFFIADMVCADNEPRQQPFRHNFVLVSKVQADGGIELSRLVWLLVVKKLRDQAAPLVVAQRKADLELLHQSDNETSSLRLVAFGLQNKF